MSNIYWWRWVICFILRFAEVRMDTPYRRSEAVVKVLADTETGSHVTTCRHALVTVPLGVLQVP